MFILSSLMDDVTFLPNDFNVNYLDIIVQKIEEKFNDKVIDGVGLVISFYDIVKIENSIVSKNDCKVFFKVTFRLVVFNPFVGEILEGYITSSDSTGIRVSLGFFADIKINESALRTPKDYDKKTESWSWKFDHHTLVYEKNQAIRFRVVSVTFNKKSQIMDANNLKDSYIPPMVIIGSVDEDGLGMSSWWR